MTKGENSAEPLVEMAFSRDDYKLRLSERLAGAFGEFAKSKLASKAGFSTHKLRGNLIQLWRDEATRLLSIGVFDAAASDVKFRSSGRKKVVTEVYTKARQTYIKRFSPWAKGKVESIFEQKISVSLTDEDVEEFLIEASEAIDVALTI